MRTRRRQINEASISFLDIISCGFGAVVLLLVVAELGDPAKRAELEQTIISSVKLLQESLFAKRKENELKKLVSSKKKRKKPTSPLSRAKSNTQSNASLESPLRLCFLRFFRLSRVFRFLRFRRCLPRFPTVCSPACPEVVLRIPASSV